MIALLLYVLTISRNLGASHDSIAYINTIEHGSGIDLFHPHHLMYHTTAKLWLRAADRIESIRGLDGALVVAALNSLFGALCTLMSVLLLRERMGLSMAASCVVATLASFSYGFWFYSCCVEVYIIPLFFLLLSLWFISSTDLTIARALGAGLTHGVAILFHQSHVLFTPVVLVAFFLNRRGRVRSIWRPFLAYAGTCCMAAALPYLTVLLIVLRVDSLHSAFLWVTMFGHISGVSFWNPPAVSTAFKAALGFARAFVGGQFLFALPDVRAMLNRYLHNKSLTDEEFLVRDLSPIGARLLVAGVLLFGVLFIVAMALGWRRRKHLRLDPTPRAVVLAASSLLVYSGFFFFWDSSNVEFWIPQSVFFWLLFGWRVLAGRPGNERGKGEFGHGWSMTVTWVMAVLLGAVNYSGSMHYMRVRENDMYFCKVAPIAGLAQGNDLIVIGEDWVWKEYYTRYTAVETLSMARLGVGRSGESLALDVRERIEARRWEGGWVWITEEAVEMGYIEDDGEAEALREILWDELRPDWRTIDFSVQEAYVLWPLSPGEAIEKTTRIVQ